MILPEDLLYLIYRTYYTHHVLDELTKEIENWVLIEHPKTPSFQVQKCKCMYVVGWLRIACRTHQFWDSPRPIESNTIEQVTLDFDDSWNAQDKQTVVEELSKICKVLKNGIGHVKISLQDEDDRAWNEWALVHTNRGIQNIKNKVIYRIENERAYIKDELGRRSCEFIGLSPESSSCYDDLPASQRIPWFRWIP